ncbi:Uncharacterised protein [Mycobacteroides abscessus subsp. massiliense]|nr:Uncharacterised protein [Mycobacteroides abscessus subsp. massiliense]
MAALIRRLRKQISDRAITPRGHRVYPECGHSAADRDRKDGAGQAEPVGLLYVRFGGQRTQHQHENHQCQGFDQELRQRQVGCAVQGEDGARSVAGDAHQQHRGQTVAHDGSADRRGEYQ